jgi:hypothetical protein
MISTEAGMLTFLHPHHLNADRLSSGIADGDSNSIVFADDSQNMKYGEMQLIEDGITRRSSLPKYIT